MPQYVRNFRPVKRSSVQGDRKIKNTSRLVAVALCLPWAAVAQAQAIPDSQAQSPWFSNAQSLIAQRSSSTNPGTEAKNVILFVGDGMGLSTLTASRILGGQRAGGSGEESALSFELFPHTALVKTYNVNAQIPDSAGTMTAMMSGVKTNAGVVGINASATVSNCLDQAGNELVSALDLAEIKGLATGVVTTTRVTHATPAATYAKSVQRSWEDISDQPDDVVSQGCEDIASQLVNFESNLEQRFPKAKVDGIDVVFGGGRRHFLPNVANDSYTNLYGQNVGDRTDGQNLIEQWQDQYTNGRYVFNESGLDALDTTQPGNVFGLFSSSHVQYEADRAVNSGVEPALSKMVEKAIALLSKDPDGYLLVVESGRIDHAHHAGNASGALTETLELSLAVSRAVDLTSSNDTLILVTADHSHVMTLAGSPRRGNPILGKVVGKGGSSPSSAADGLPYTTIGYANGPGFRNYGDDSLNPDRTYADAPVGGRQDLNAVNTESPGFHQEALVPLVAETHGGEDVSIHASGPGAFRIRGTIEQNVIFHVIDKALGLTQ